MLTVHFVGVPPGTADLLIKFVPPETLERFGGAGNMRRPSYRERGVLLASDVFSNVTRAE